MRLLLIAALAAPALLAGCGKPQVEPEFGAKVRAYLMANPEVLVEVSEALQKKQADERLKKASMGISRNRDKLERDDRDHVLNPDGRVTVVQFFDYNCGYCKVIAPQVLDMARQHPDVRFVFKDMVIFGETSQYAAAAASLASSPEQYTKIHRAFMTTKPLDDAAVDRILRANGVDPAAARARQESADRRAYWNDVHELASELGIDGTPAFVVGETLIPGADPNALKAAIAAAKRGKGKPSASSAAADAPASAG